MTEKMNPEVKAKWLKALRSGEYSQTTDVLTDFEGGFCCLGVLCDIRRKELKKGKETFFRHILEDTGGYEVLPESVRKWAGLHDANPRIINKHDFTHLSGLNDKGKSFSYIANLIEEHF